MEKTHAELAIESLNALEERRTRILASVLELEATQVTKAEEDQVVKDLVREGLGAVVDFAGAVTHGLLAERSKRPA